MSHQAGGDRTSGHAVELSSLRCLHEHDATVCDDVFQAERTVAARA